jgi:hypothetical protein
VSLRSPAPSPDDERRHWRDLIVLRSAEGALVCGNGCGWYSDCVCPTWEPLGDPYASVLQVLAWKDPQRVQRVAAGWAGDRPVQIERGVLLDGHHRVAAAFLGLAPEMLPTRQVTGVLDEQKAFHARLVRDHRERLRAAPAA